MVTSRLKHHYLIMTQHAKLSFHYETMTPKLKTSDAFLEFNFYNISNHMKCN